MAPEADAPAKLANWYSAPHSTWAFHNVDALIPVSPVAAAGEAWSLAADPNPVDRIAFEDSQGGERPLGAFLDRNAARGLIVLRGGRIAAERYGNGYDGSRPHILFSVTKSVTGLLAGILADRGDLDPEAPVTRYVPEVAASAYGDCAVRHLLDMTVSAAFTEDYDDPASDYSRYRAAAGANPPPEGADPGTLHEFLARIGGAPAPHGEAFQYLSPNSDLLGWVLERAAGRPYAELLSGLIWQPLGTEASGFVTVDRAGAARAAGGFCAIPRDLARLGEMLRLGGAVQGRQVVPRWWIDDIRAGGGNAPWLKGNMRHLYPEGSYRSQWYQTGLPSGAFAAMGIHGQWLWIDPAREVVIAMVSNQPKPYRDAIDLALIRAFDALAAAL